MRFLRTLALLLCGLPVFGATRWMVELTDEPAVRSETRSAVSQRAAVRAQQARVQSALEAAGARVLSRVENVANAIAVEAESAEALEALPGVKRVHPVRRHKLHLDQAVIVHRVTEAIRIAGERADGRGIRIGILDTGIEASHPGFQDPGLTMPVGFPKVNHDRDLALTNAKVIVARSYANLFETREDDLSASDRVGHGTGAAMAAAGAPNQSLQGAVAGIAPKAYLGNYKIFGSSGINETTTTDLILKALDDAVADGMDVVNLSLGDSVAPLLEVDPEVDAVRRAAAAGVIVVVSAGNSGPDPGTIGSPGTAPAALTVGAMRNARVFSASATIDGIRPYLATTGTGPRPPAPVKAALQDVANLDSSGLACNPLPASSLSDRVALILRGTCTFQVKLANALRAGALAAIVYTSVDRPVTRMDAQGEQLPAVMVSYADGVDLKNRLTGNAQVVISVDFDLKAVAVDPNQLSRFSSAGPSVNQAIKPEIVAVGEDLLTATQRSVSSGGLYNETGYALMDGTSFSAPLAAGAAAILKASRPGLSAEQYRSILVTSATPFPAWVQQAGSGALNVESALYCQLTLQPATLGFGAGGGSPSLTREVRVTNVGNDPVEYAVAVASFQEKPAVSVSTNLIRLAPGESTTVRVELIATGLPGGVQEGFVTFTHSVSGHTQRVPYWYAVRTNTPGHITILDQETSAVAGATIRNAIFFRIIEESGVPVTDANADVTVTDGTGTVREVTRIGFIYPGVFRVSVELGRGVNVFRISVGGIIRDVSIVGT
ncbi:MAG: S8 family serine peptidase [Bryobacteraceae bacterium]